MPHRPGCVSTRSEWVKLTERVGHVTPSGEDGLDDRHRLLRIASHPQQNNCRSGHAECALNHGLSVEPVSALHELFAIR